MCIKYRILSSLLDRHNKWSFIKKLPPKSKIIDIGCGNDSPQKIKSVKKDCYYVGIDVGDYNINKHSKDMADGYILTTSECFADEIRKAGEVYAGFNAVISAHNLEHCEKPTETLLAIFSVLDKGGKLFLAFPSEASIDFPSRVGTLNFYDDKTHIYLPDFNKIQRMLLDNGFKILFSTPQHKPFLKNCLGRILDLIIKKRITPFTWAHYGFEAIIWAEKIAK